MSLLCGGSRNNELVHFITVLGLHSLEVNFILEENHSALRKGLALGVH